ncbi:unnamed protein product [Paramecium sonneborni]|uniref:Uncharacterized protein n=1 Tax=Paramecium sonneborni TaxID=65129 RepID=A0A8S1MYI1_9CILI|nr:unnamed protein product [Paramecium sonneborni]
MGTITLGNCQCQCYINYVSCDCSCDQNEIRTIRSNRFTEQSTRNRSKKRSPGDSSDRQSKFSSTQKPTSRSKSSNSDKSIYLLSDYCNITTESLKQRKKSKPNPTFIKSRSLYIFDVDIDKNLSNNVEQSSTPLSLSDIGTINRPKMQSMDKGVLKKSTEQVQQKKYVKWNLPQHYLRQNKQQQQEFYS